MFNLIIELSTCLSLSELPGSVKKSVTKGDCQRTLEKHHELLQKIDAGLYPDLKIQLFTSPE